jgi:hypothetical protein
LNAGESPAFAAQPEFMSTSARSGRRPFRRSKRRRSPGVTVASGSFEARSEMSTTTAGTINSAAEIRRRSDARR